ncbi:MAG: endonuclease MutS2 [Bacteroidetes bacterium]|nr:MAG: endonuclease MutS2 [Bacteroidota bacterium]
MLYPTNIEQKIGFDKIRELVKKECFSEPARIYVEEMKFLTDVQKIELLLQQTAEFQYIIAGDEAFPSENFIDPREFLHTCKIEGSILSEEAFYLLKTSLQTVNKCVLFLQKRKLEVPNLAQLCTDIAIDAQLLKDINRIIDENGKVKDGASKALFDLRNDIRDEQNYLRKKLDSILKNAVSQGFSPEDMSLTVRNGRMVLPVLAENKRKIQGLIHGESATGQTVFIEPIEVFDSNNRIYELEIAERREINRILLELTAQLRLILPELHLAYSFLALIDFIRAKATFSNKIKATKQNSIAQTHSNWIQTFHPLLYLNLVQSKKNIVPLTVNFDENQRIILISGPNAGGKSVVLKTIGILQFMHQCGLPVPNGEACTFGVFDDIFIDIGDEQSIDNDLSTYSSHLTNMREIIKFSGKKSLVLIDEFGTGTDPQYGGAIAESILEQLVNNQVFGAINTHYSNLKYYAESANTIVNAAMLYDLDSLNPKYVLAIGKPGNSFALEIASKIGLSPLVLERAKSKIGSQKLDLDKLVMQLQKEKDLILTEKTTLEKNKRNLQVSVDQYEELKKHIATSKNQILHEARIEAKKIVQTAKIEASNVIRELKETSKYDAKQVELSRQKLQEQDAFLASKINEMPKPKIINEVLVQKSALKIGDTVVIIGQESFYKILKINKNDVELSLGNIKTTVKLDRIKKINAGEKKKPEPIPKSVKGINLLDRMAKFSTTLDVRGKRTEDAIATLDSYLDDALLLSQTELKIIHGKGDGILRKMIREHLKRLTYVQNFRDEHIEFGGDGITLITLK